MGHFQDHHEEDEGEPRWRKSGVDFETFAISATIDPNTFSSNSLVVPIVTSSVFLLHRPATGQAEHKVARFLQGHPSVLHVSHPGLRSHPQHQLALRQQFGLCGMVGFLIKGGIKEGNTFLDSLHVFQSASSLGADISLASIPTTASHSWLPEEERLKMGITENFIRLSVGLESPEKLSADLDQALTKAVPVKIVAGNIE